MKALSLAGARIKVLINNEPIGFVTGFSWSVDYGKKTIRGLDSPHPQEIAPTQQTVKGTIRCIRIKSFGGLEDYGIVAEQGTAAKTADTSSTRVSDIQIEKYISIALMDVGDQDILFKVDKASVSGQNWSVNARGLLQGSFSFEAFLTSPLRS